MDSWNTAGSTNSRAAAAESAQEPRVDALELVDAHLLDERLRGGEERGDGHPGQDQGRGAPAPGRGSERVGGGRGDFGVRVAQVAGKDVGIAILGPGSVLARTRAQRHERPGQQPALELRNSGPQGLRDGRAGNLFERVSRPVCQLLVRQ